MRRRGCVVLCASVMRKAPDGLGRLELTKFRNPPLVPVEPANAPPNTPGLRSIMFNVDDIDDDVARLNALRPASERRRGTGAVQD